MLILSRNGTECRPLFEAQIVFFCEETLDTSLSLIVFEAVSISVGCHLRAYFESHSCVTLRRLNILVIEFGLISAKICRTLVTLGNSMFDTACSIIH